MSIVWIFKQHKYSISIDIFLHNYTGFVPNFSGSLRRDMFSWQNRFQIWVATEKTKVPFWPFHCNKSFTFALSVVELFYLGNHLDIFLKSTRSDSFLHLASPKLLFRRGIKDRQLGSKPLVLRFGQSSFVEGLHCVIHLYTVLERYKSGIIIKTYLSINITYLWIAPGKMTYLRLC